MPLVAFKYQQCNAQKKCENILKVLMRSQSNYHNLRGNVQSLIQDLINKKIDPEIFVTKINQILPFGSISLSQQQGLISLLYVSLPYVSNLLYLGELSIDGISPPCKPCSVAICPHEFYRNVFFDIMNSGERNTRYTCLVETCVACNKKQTNKPNISPLYCLGT